MPILTNYKPFYLLGVVLLAVLFFILIAPRATQDELIESMWLVENPTESLDVEDVLRENFQPVTNYLSLGYNASAQWVRLRIQPAADGNEVVVSFRSSAPDQIQFFTKTLTNFYESNSDAKVEKYKLESPLWPSPIRGFTIEPPNGGGEYLVRIKSAGSINLYITAQPLREAILTAERNFILQILYLSMMFFLMLWAAQMFVASGQNIFKWFSIMQFFTLIHNIFFLGYGNRIFGNLLQSGDVDFFRISAFTGSFFTIVFHRAVFMQFKPAFQSLKLFEIQLYAIIISFIIYMFFDQSRGLQLNVICLGLTPVAFLINATTARNEVAPSLLVMRVIYFTLSASFLLNSLSFLGLSNFNLVLVYGYLIHGLATALLMLLFLHLSVNDVFLKVRSAEYQRLKMEVDNQAQMEINRTLSEFIYMLGHEARNAMSVIQMSITKNGITEQQRARINNSILGLNHVINRCHEVIQVGNVEIKKFSEESNLAEIMDNLCVELDIEKRIKLHIQGSSIVQGDLTLLDVLFRNLIDNALKYSPRSSDVFIKIACDTDECSIIFINEPNQAGWPDPVRLFEKYYRAPGAHSERGSGLGLHIARTIVDLLGGSIYYVPTAQYVRFQVRFPC